MATPTVQQVLTDPEFQGYTPAQKLAILQKIDPVFARMTPAQQQAVLAKAAPMGFQQREPPAFAGEEPAGPQPGSQVPDVTTAGGVMSQFAGGVGETLNPANIVRGLASGMQSKDPHDVMLASLARGYGGPAAEAIARTIAIPGLNMLTNAGDWYQKAVRGKIPYAYEQALTAVPEALGQGAAQAALMRGPIESLARTDPVNALARYARLSPAGPVPIRPGPLFGVATRAKAAMNAIESQHASVPVSPLGAYSRAIEAYQATQHGFTMPKPISDFLDVMQRQNGQMTFEQARQFEKSLGETTTWEGKTDFMNGLMKQMREALVRDNTVALERASPGTGRQYQVAKAQFERASTAKAQGGKLAGATGAIAGYELGGKMGNPLAVGAVAAPLFRHFLRGAGETAIEGVTNLPRPFANIPGTTRLTPFAAGFTAPVHQPPQGDEE